MKDNFEKALIECVKIQKKRVILAKKKFTKAKSSIDEGMMSYFSYKEEEGKLEAYQNCLRTYKAFRS